MLQGSLTGWAKLNTLCRYRSGGEVTVSGTGNVQAALQKANADLEEANRELHDLREVWPLNSFRHVHFCAPDACSKLPVCMALTAASVLFELAQYLAVVLQLSLSIPCVSPCSLCMSLPPCLSLSLCVLVRSTWSVPQGVSTFPPHPSPPLEPSSSTHDMVECSM